MPDTAEDDSVGGRGTDGRARSARTGSEGGEEVATRRPPALRAPPPTALGRPHPQIDALRRQIV
eukprot:1433473-Prymnesium_polylepis.1